MRGCLGGKQYILFYQVRVRGLVGRRGGGGPLSLNGTSGVVVGFEVAKERYRVALQQLPAATEASRSQQVVGINRANLARTALQRLT